MDEYFSYGPVEHAQTLYDTLVLAKVVKLKAPGPKSQEFTQTRELLKAPKSWPLRSCISRSQKYSY